MHNSTNPFEEIEARICKLQKSHISLQEQLKNTQHNFERDLDDSALRMIDILDLIGTVTANMDRECDNTHTQLIFKKIEKRIVELIKRWQVQEIIFTDNRIEAGKARVLETRKASEEIPAGTILEVCRKGYQRDNKIIRPADVITASN